MKRIAIIEFVIILVMIAMFINQQIKINRAYLLVGDISGQVTEISNSIK